MDLDNSVVAYNTSQQGEGGGIYSTSSLVVTNSLVSENRASMAGGISNRGGEATIVASTISGNSEGGILNLGTLFEWSTLSQNAHGSAFDNRGNVDMVNVTISGNDPGPGLRNDTGARMTITNGTIVGRISNGASIRVTSTIIAGICVDRQLASLGHNLDSYGTCGLDGTGDLSDVDPRLAPLGDNGGPTLTHALQLDSPAVDAGNDEQPQQQTREASLGRSMVTAIVSPGAISVPMSWIP